MKVKKTERCELARRCVVFEGLDEEPRDRSSHSLLLDSCIPSSTLELKFGSTRVNSVRLVPMVDNWESAYCTRASSFLHAFPQKILCFSLSLSLFFSVESFSASHLLRRSPNQLFFQGFRKKGQISEEEERKRRNKNRRNAVLEIFCRGSLYLFGKIRRIPLLC